MPPVETTQDTSKTDKDDKPVNNANGDKRTEQPANNAATDQTQTPLQQQVATELTTPGDRPVTPSGTPTNGAPALEVADTQTRRLNDETLNRMADDLNAAIHYEKWGPLGKDDPQEDKIFATLEPLSREDRERIQAIYGERYGKGDKNTLRNHLDDKLSDVDFRRAEAVLNRQDNRSNDAGALMVAIERMEKDKDRGNKDVREILGNLSKAQIDQLSKDWKQHYPDKGDFLDYLGKAKNLSKETREALSVGDKVSMDSFLLKGAQGKNGEGRTQAEIVALANIALKYKNTEMLGQAIGGDMPATAAARKQLKDDPNFMNQFNKQFRNNPVAKDFLNEGRVSLATIAEKNAPAGWFDNPENTTLAIDNASETERRMFAAGRRLSIGEQLSADELQQLGAKPEEARAYYDKIHKALRDSGGGINDSERDRQVAIWEDRLLRKGGSLISQMAETNGNKFGVNLFGVGIGVGGGHSRQDIMSKVENMSEDEWKRLRDPKDGAQYRRDIEASLQIYTDEGERARILRIIDQKASENDWNKAKTIRRTIQETIDDNQETVLGFIKSGYTGKNIVDSVMNMSAEEQNKYRTDKNFRDQLNNFMREHMTDDERLLSDRILKRVETNTQPTEQDQAVDRIIKNQIDGKEPLDSLRDIETALADKTLRDRLRDVKPGRDSEDARLRAVIDNAITSAAMKSGQYYPGAYSESGYDGRVRDPYQTILDNYGKSLFERGTLPVDAKLGLGFKPSDVYKELHIATQTERDAALRQMKPAEREIAENAIKQQGKLDLIDQMRSFIVGDGSSQQQFKEALSKLTPTERQELREKYNEKYVKDRPQDGSPRDNLNSDFLTKIPEAERITWNRLLMPGTTDGRQEIYDMNRVADDNRGGLAEGMDGTALTLDRTQQQFRDLMQEYQGEIDPKKLDEIAAVYVQALEQYKASKEKAAEILVNVAIAAVGIAVGIATGGVAAPLIIGALAGMAMRTGVKAALLGGQFDSSAESLFKEAAIGALTGGLNALGPEALVAVSRVGRVAMPNIAKAITREVAEEGGERLVKSTVPRITGKLGSETTEGYVEKELKQLWAENMYGRLTQEQFKNNIDNIATKIANTKETKGLVGDELAAALKHNEAVVQQVSSRLTQTFNREVLDVTGKELKVAVSEGAQTLGSRSVTTLRTTVAREGGYNAVVAEATNVASSPLYSYMQNGEFSLSNYQLTPFSALPIGMPLAFRSGFSTVARVGGGTYSTINNNLDNFTNRSSQYFDPGMHSQIRIMNGDQVVHTPGNESGRIKIEDGYYGVDSTGNRVDLLTLRRQSHDGRILDESGQPTGEWRTENQTLRNLADGGTEVRPDSGGRYVVNDDGNVTELDIGPQKMRFRHDLEGRVSRVTIEGETLTRTADGFVKPDGTKAEFVDVSVDPSSGTIRYLYPQDSALRIADQNLDGTSVVMFADGRAQSWDAKGNVVSQGRWKNPDDTTGDGGTVRGGGGEEAEVVRVADDGGTTVRPRVAATEEPETVVRPSMDRELSLDELPPAVRTQLEPRLAALSDNHRFAEWLPARSPEEHRASIENVQRRMQEIRVQNSDGTVTSVYDRVEGSGLTRERKDAIYAVASYMDDHYRRLSVEMPDGSFQMHPAQLTNEVHTLGEMAEAIRIGEQLGMSQDQIMKGTIGSMISDLNKTVGGEKVVINGQVVDTTPGNFFAHHVQSSQMAAEILPRVMDMSNPKNVEFMEDIIKAIKEHQVAPPEFMAGLYVNANIRPSVNAFNNGIVTPEFHQKLQDGSFNPEETRRYKLLMDDMQARADAGGNRATFDEAVGKASRGEPLTAAEQDLVAKLRADQETDLNKLQFAMSRPFGLTAAEDLELKGLRNRPAESLSPTEQNRILVLEAGSGAQKRVGISEAEVTELDDLIARRASGAEYDQARYNDLMSRSDTVLAFSTEGQRNLLRVSSPDVRDWHVSNPNNRWNAEALLIHYADGGDNYFTARGAAKIVQLRASNNPMGFRDQLLVDSVLSSAASGDDVFNNGILRDPRARDAILQLQAQRDDAINRIFYGEDGLEKWARAEAARIEAETGVSLRRQREPLAPPDEVTYSRLREKMDAEARFSEQEIERIQELKATPVTPAADAELRQIYQQHGLSSMEAAKYISLDHAREFQDLLARSEALDFTPQQAARMESLRYGLAFVDTPLAYKLNATETKEFDALKAIRESGERPLTDGEQAKLAKFEDRSKWGPAEDAQMEFALRYNAEAVNRLRTESAYNPIETPRGQDVVVDGRRVITYDSGSELRFDEAGRPATMRIGSGDAQQTIAFEYKDKDLAVVRIAAADGRQVEHTFNPATGRYIVSAAGSITISGINNGPHRMITFGPNGSTLARSANGAAEFTPVSTRGMIRDASGQLVPFGQELPSMRIIREAASRAGAKGKQRLLPDGRIEWMVHADDIDELADGSVVVRPSGEQTIPGTDRPIASITYRPDGTTEVLFKDVEQGQVQDLVSKMRGITDDAPSAREVEGGSPELAPDRVPGAGDNAVLQGAEQSRQLQGGSINAFGPNVQSVALSDSDQLLFRFEAESNLESTVRIRDNRVVSARLGQDGDRKFVNIDYDEAGQPILVRVGDSEAGAFDSHELGPDARYSVNNDGSLTVRGISRDGFDAVTYKPDGSRVFTKDSGLMDGDSVVELGASTPEQLLGKLQSTLDPSAATMPRDVAIRYGANGQPEQVTIDNPALRSASNSGPLVLVKENGIWRDQNSGTMYRGVTVAKDGSVTVHTDRDVRIDSDDRPVESITFTESGRRVKFFDDAGQAEVGSGGDTTQPGIPNGKRVVINVGPGDDFYMTEGKWTVKGVGANGELHLSATLISPNNTYAPHAPGNAGRPLAPNGEPIVGQVYVVTRKGNLEDGWSYAGAGRWQKQTDRILDQNELYRLASDYPEQLRVETFRTPAGRPVPEIDAKPGDKVYRNGKRWKVVSAENGELVLRLEHYSPNNRFVPEANVGRPLDPDGGPILGQIYVVDRKGTLEDGWMWYGGHWYKGKDETVGLDELYDLSSANDGLIRVNGFGAGQRVEQGVIRSVSPHGFVVQLRDPELEVEIRNISRDPLAVGYKNVETNFERIVIDADGRMFKVAENPEGGYTLTQDANYRVLPFEGDGAPLPRTRPFDPGEVMHFNGNKARILDLNNREALLYAPNNQSTGTQPRATQRQIDRDFQAVTIDGVTYYRRLNEPAGQEGFVFTATLTRKGGYEIKQASQFIYKQVDDLDGGAVTRAGDADAVNKPIKHSGEASRNFDQPPLAPGHNSSYGWGLTKSHPSEVYRDARVRITDASGTEIQIRGDLEDGFTFGRSPDNDIVLPDSYVSGYHGKVHWDAERQQFFVENLSRTNGTEVARSNGEHMLFGGQEGNPAYGDRIYFGPADEIQIAGYRLKLEAPNAKGLRPMTPYQMKNDVQVFIGGQPLRLENNLVVLGFGKQNFGSQNRDILERLVSRNHARLDFDPTSGRWTITDTTKAKDANSPTSMTGLRARTVMRVADEPNGTFIERRMHDGSTQWIELRNDSQGFNASAQIQPGDKIHLGSKEGPEIRIHINQNAAVRPDGSVVFVRENGDTVTKRPDGTQEIRSAFGGKDGMVRIEDADGKVLHVTQRSGAAMAYGYDDAGELSLIKLADGSEARLQDGEWIHINQDGSTQPWWRGELAVESDGSLRYSDRGNPPRQFIDRLDGSREIIHPNGRVEYTNLDKLAELRYVRGSLVDLLDAQVLATRNRYAHLPEAQLRRKIADAEALARSQRDEVFNAMGDFERRMSARAASGDADAAQVNQQLAESFHHLRRILEAGEGAPLSLDKRLFLVRQTLAQLAVPPHISQGHNNTCNVTTIEKRLYYTNPNEAVRLISDIATTGRYVTADGRMVDLTRVPGAIEPDAEAASVMHGGNLMLDGRRSYASQIFEIAAVNIKYGSVADAHRIVLYEKAFFGPQHMRVHPDGWKHEKEGLFEYSYDYTSNSLVRTQIGKSPELGFNDLAGIEYQITGQPPGRVLAGANAFGGKPGVVPSRWDVQQFAGQAEIPQNFNEFKDLMRTANSKDWPMIAMISTGHPEYFPKQAAAIAKDPDATGGHVITVHAARENPPGTGQWFVDIENQWGSTYNWQNVRLEDLWEMMQPRHFGNTPVFGSQPWANQALADGISPNDYTPSTAISSNGDTRVGVAAEPVTRLDEPGTIPYYRVLGETGGDWARTAGDGSAFDTTPLKLLDGLPPDVVARANDVLQTATVQDALQRNTLIDARMASLRAAGLSEDRLARAEMRLQEMSLGNLRVLEDTFSQIGGRRVPTISETRAEQVENLRTLLGSITPDMSPQHRDAILELAARSARGEVVFFRPSPTETTRTTRFDNPLQRGSICSAASASALINRLVGQEQLAKHLVDVAKTQKRFGGFQAMAEYIPILPDGRIGVTAEHVQVITGDATQGIYNNAVSKVVAPAVEHFSDQQFSVNLTGWSGEPGKGVLTFENNWHIYTAELDGQKVSIYDPLMNTRQLKSASEIEVIPLSDPAYRNTITSNEGRSSTICKVGSVVPYAQRSVSTVQKPPAVRPDVLRKANPDLDRRLDVIARGHDKDTMHDILRHVVAAEGGLRNNADGSLVIPSTFKATVTDDHILMASLIKVSMQARVTEETIERARVLLDATAPLRSTFDDPKHHLTVLRQAALPNGQTEVLPYLGSLTQELRQKWMQTADISSPSVATHLTTAASRYKNPGIVVDAIRNRAIKIFGDRQTAAAKRGIKLANKLTVEDVNQAIDELLAASRARAGK